MADLSTLSGISAEVSSIQSAAATWQTQAQAALAAPAGAPAGTVSDTLPPGVSPGTPGGGAGGGGGGGGDGGDGGDTGDAGAPSESPAVQQFRESGGTWDPFSDEPMDEGDMAAAADARAALEEGEPVSDTGDMADTGDETAPSSDEARALLESGDEMAGLEFEWYDIFHPAGIGMRALQESQKGGPAEFQTATTRPQQGRPSPELAAQLAASKRKLADVQRRYAAAMLARSAAVAAPPVVSTAAAPMATDSTAAAAAVLDNQGDAVVGAREKIRRKKMRIAGYPMDETRDILLETYEHQITDAEPDPERLPASVHRGAAYLDHLTYPPGGASSGREGGVMAPEQDIIFGEKDIHILGADYVRGLDALAGAAVPARKIITSRAGFVKRTTPAGNVHTSLVTIAKRGDNKASIKNAKDAGNRALSVAAKLDKLKATPTAVRGAISAQDKAILERRAAKGSAINVAKLKQLSGPLKKAGKDALASADKHAKLVQAQETKQKSGLANVRNTYGPPGVKGTHITGVTQHDLVDDILGAYCEVVGQVALPDPANPGYMTDGTVDPSYGAPAPAAAAAPAAGGGVAGPPDYGVGPAPTLDSDGVKMVAFVDYMPDPNPDGYDMTIYDSTQQPLPQGVVLYDKSQPIPWQGVGSFTRFKPSEDMHDGKGPSGFQWGGGGPDIMDGWYWWWHGATSGTQYKHDTGPQPTGANYPPYNPGLAGMPEAKARALASQGMGWGPLIGNPKGWTKGLRYDVGTDTWFWFWDSAPQWAQEPIMTQRINKAILDYKTAVATAKTDYVTQQMQDKLDAQQAAALLKQQAAEDAATARQQQQEQQAAQHQADVQAVQDTAEAKRQELVDEATARQAAAQADIEQKAALTQAQIDRQAAEEQAAIEQRAAETAAKLEMMTPPPEEGGAASAEESPAAQLDTEDFVDNVEEDFTGMPVRIRGADRLRLKRMSRW